MELMPLNIAGKILLDLLKVNENLMGGKVSLTWTPLVSLRAAARSWSLHFRPAAVTSRQS